MHRKPNLLGSIVRLLAFSPLIAASAAAAGPSFAEISARWWGTLKDPDPEACPVLGDSCEGPASGCVCAMHVDGTLRCVDGRALSSCVVPCREDAECVAPQRCYGDRGGVGCCSIGCGDVSPDPALCNQPFVCGQELGHCSPANENCSCMSRPDGSGLCVDLSAGCDAFGACPGGDVECPFGSVCIVDTCCNRRDQCVPICGDPPPDLHACADPGSSPFCLGGVTNECGDGTAVCHCTHQAADGLGTDGAGVCVDSNQFADCGSLPWCGGLGDAFCETVEAGSRCVYDDCCQWRCVLSCGDAPPSIFCPDPSSCGQMPNFCGGSPGCLCLPGAYGDGICVDVSEIHCALPCDNDANCPPDMMCDGGGSCCGYRVCVPPCQSGGLPVPADATWSAP